MRLDYESAGDTSRRSRGRTVRAAAAMVPCVLWALVFGAMAVAELRGGVRVEGLFAVVCFLMGVFAAAVIAFSR